MKRLALVSVLVLLAPYHALAQDNTAVRVLPFTFGAFGGATGGTTTIHLGGGVETILWKGIGAGAELGYMAPFPSGLEYGIGVMSLNGVYEPLTRGRRITPFASGGYTLAFREGWGNAINFGGGFNYWMSDGVALRVEFRDHMPVYDGGIENWHFWGMRVGITWKR